ncbi:phosphoglycolate phosphatase [Pararobbsia silviterrae]|uniref:Phosphoglycolate phosphatase n=1 Tax=Pararobbsia silviterrae TaxID=1792498 RepID=A0A494X635_9BURK|nr:phosphoglycolate phosphatase [Pararobbsia silviterrae]RKP45782.1 phosphoglycolate phosphatase [Pararobbsia silviterrae]
MSASERPTARIGEETPGHARTADPAARRAEIRGVIIDLDGTMVDTAGDFHAALNRMLADLELPSIDSDELLRYIGKGSEHLVRSVLSARLPADHVEARFATALDRYQHAYAQVNGMHASVYTHVAEGLAALRDAGLKLACVTNKPHRFAVALLTQVGLHAYFDAVFGGDSFARKKPDPLPMLKASEALGLAPAQMLAIGDSENDALAARAAGIAVLTVPYGYNHGQPVQSIDSDGIVGTLLEAARWLHQ